MKERNLDALSKISVLYLEDEETLLKQTTSVLEDFVKTIYPCKDINAATEVILNKKVDVIISDILLENGLGIEFLKKIRTEGYQTPFIFTTAYTDTKYMLEAIKFSANGYIVKPINVKDLLNMIYDVIIPILKEDEYKKNEYIIKAVAAVTDTKAVEVIKFIVNNLNEDMIFNYPHSVIMENIDVSKPTVIKLFKQLADLEILVKLQNSKYEFRPQNLKNLEI